MLPHRLLERLSSLEHLKSNRRANFADMYKCTNIDCHMRIDAEVVAFLDKFTETLNKGAEMWLRPPLALMALGDAGPRRDVAVAVTEALNGRTHKQVTPLSKHITPQTMAPVQLPTDVVRTIGTLAATGQHCDDSPLNDWLCQWVSSCPHQNLAVEGLFNIMDAVACVGGPRLGAVEKEIRVKALCNVVLPQRVQELSPKTGKAKQHHTTRANVRRAAEFGCRRRTPGTLLSAPRKCRNAR